MKIKKCIKISLFVCILIIMSFYVGRILHYTKNDIWDIRSMEYVSKKKDMCDVLVCGTSTALANINSTELYINYGISSLCIGEPRQPTYLTYYSLKQALNYVQPKVVIFDVRSLFYTIEYLQSYFDIDERMTLHYTIDNLKFGINKFEAIRESKKLFPQMDIWNYVSRFYYEHANWEQLNKANFIRENHYIVLNENPCFIDVWKGVPESAFTKLNQYDNSIEEIPEMNLEYLQRIISLCEKNNIDIIFVKGFDNQAWTYQKKNRIEQLALEMNISFLDIVDLNEQVGIDTKVDYYDAVHYNVLGAKKWSDYLGDYLLENYSMNDYRITNEEIASNDIIQKYQIAVETLQMQIDLEFAQDFESYIEILQNIDKSSNTVFMYAQNDISQSLSSKEMDMLKQLGLSQDLLGKLQYSYLGILDQTQYYESLSPDYIEVNGKFDNDVSYLVCSDGGKNQRISGLKINDENVGANGEGLNIVVYNKTFNKIVSSVYFNTSAYVNPLKNVT